MQSFKDRIHFTFDAAMKLNKKNLNSDSIKKINGENVIYILLFFRVNKSEG